MFAQMDLLDGYGLYTKWFDFKSTEPINDYWEMMGYDENNFLLLSGSYFIMMTILIVYFFVLWIINYIAKRCAKRRTARLIGMWAF